MAFDPATAIIDLVKTGVDKFLPDKMSEAEKEQTKLQMSEFLHQEARKENSSFRQFILAYEGSVKDYQKFPIVGPIVVLWRGLIRPAFTTATGYWDWLYFTSSAAEGWTPDQEKLLLILNLIVLIFWFGERSFKILLPLINNLIRAWFGLKLDLKKEEK